MGYTTDRPGFLLRSVRPLVASHAILESPQENARDAKGRPVSSPRFIGSVDSVFVWLKSDRGREDLSDVTGINHRSESHSNDDVPDEHNHQHPERPQAASRQRRISLNKSDGK